MVPTPLEQEPPGPDRNERPVALGRQGGFGRRAYPAGDPPPAVATPGGVTLSQVALEIEDGLLMAFGPDGDPLPPAAFIAAAQEQPEVKVRLGGEELVAALRAAAVLEAQAAGPVAAMAEGAAADHWIRSMLGLGAQPAMAADDELRGEERVCELTAFARELMISMPSGGAFLITEPADRAQASAGLLLADGAGVSVARLIERVRAELGQQSDQPEAAEIALPACGIRAAGDAVVLELPAIGSVRLVDSADDGTSGPRAGIFLANGEPAAVADLVATLGGRPHADAAGQAPETTEERVAPAGGHGAGDMMVPPLEWPQVIEAAADGTADLGVLAEALDRRRDLLPSTIVIALPEGAALSAGRRNDDGSWSLAAAEVRGLTLQMPAAGQDDCVLKLTVRSLRGATARTVAVRRPARQKDPTEVAAAGAEAEAAALAGAIRLAVRPPAGEGFRPKDAALVIIGGVPQGAVLSAGIDNGDGSWMLSAQDLVGLELSLPAGCPTDLTLEVKALAVTSRDGTIASATEPLRLAPDPGAASIPLVIDRAAVDGLQALMIRDLPHGARLSAGTYDPASDAWVLLPRQLDGLSVTPADAADFTLTVTGIARDADGRAEARLVTRLPIAPA